MRLVQPRISLLLVMRRLYSVVVLLFAIVVSAASKPHSVTLGSSQPVKLFVGPSEEKTMDITVRPLYVDAKVKDFTTANA